jgi:hypothetical protein
MSPKLSHATVDQERFRQLALSGLSDREIAETLGCSPPSIGRWRDRLDLPRSQKAGGPRPGPASKQAQMPEVPGFFAQIDSPEKAYVLGFLIADGHIYKTGNRVELGVKEADSAVLTAITEAMGLSVPLRVALNSYDKSRFIRVTLGGRQAVTELAQYGLRNDKSKTATWPTIDPALEGHLARGIWDGDGSIQKYMFELIGTSALLDGIVAAAERNTGCQLRRRMSGKENRYHYAYGTRRDTAILHWMYSGATIALKRKQEKFLTYWSEIPSAESLNLRIGPRVYTRKSQGRSAADYPSAS